MHENNEVKSIRLDEIIPNRLQPRTEFDNVKLNELANSIKQHGIINPLILRQIGNQYEIVAGERRYRASKLLGIETIPARIIDADDNTSAQIAIIENIQRENLSVIEEARAYRKLLDVCGINQTQLAKKLDKSEESITSKMRLLSLCDEVQESLIHNKITELHARALLQLKNIDDQRELLDKILEQKLSVKQTESEIKKMHENSTKNYEKISMQISPDIRSNINENIYGNDIVSIDDLNKKEIEKEDNSMNEQNLNVNPTVVTNPTTEAMNNEQNTGATTPAFGERFFPSLEDQPTNINMNNVFDTNTQMQPQEVNSPVVETPQPVQPMMENLVENKADPNVVPQPISPTPNMESVAQPNIPTFVTNRDSIPPVEAPIESFVPPVTELPQENVSAPFVSPVETIPNQIVDTPTVQPPIENPIPPVDIPQPVIQTPQEEYVTPIAQPPVVESASVDIAQPMMNMPETTTEEQQPSQTGDVLSAMNAIKNLALSIQSIGYRASINEENETDKYRITIELQK